ncbi:MAG: biopolymer transporter ExbD [Bacteroidota bacterium]
MAQLDTGGGDSKGGKHQKQRAKKQSTHIDMTPMVDLAFLLLTFFVLTSTFSKPVTMEITMPVKPKDKEDKTEVKHIVTLVVTKGDTVAWYYGKLDTASAAPFNISSFSKDGIRKVLMENNRETIKKIQEIEKKILADKSMDEQKRKELYTKQAVDLMGEKDALTVVIKTTDDAKYGRVVDMVDEMSIVNVGKYALVDISETELAFLQQQKIIK